MRNTSNYFLLLLAYLIFSCSDNQSDTTPTLERSVKNVTYQDIPNVMAKLGHSLGRLDVTRSTANNSTANTIIGQIELDKILEVIDTLNNASYTFLVDDEDYNPYTFSNLIITKKAQTDYETPYLLEYEVDSTFMIEFVNSGFSMDNFTGRIVKRYLSNFSFNQGSQANLEGNKSTTQAPGPCDLIIEYDSGDLTGGSGPTDGGAGDSNGPGDTTGGGGTGSWSANCVESYESIWVENHCYKYVSDIENTPRCHGHYIRVRTLNCGEPPSQTEINDGTNCPTLESEEIGIIISDEEMREIILLNHLNDNPNSLLDIPCDQIEKWRNIAEHVPNQQVIDKLEFLNNQNNSNLFGIGFDIQTLAGAFGGTVNMDNFSVTVTELPNGMTANTLLELMRKNLNNFIDTDLSNFSPYDLTPTGTDENALWNSSNPLGSIIHINIPGDNASVVCSDYSNDRWRFSTITSPADYLHPISGTREFGYERNPDGSYNFYTRGVDRVTIALGGDDQSGILSFGDILMTKLAFSGADNLWKSLQSGIEDFVNANGGYAFKNDPILFRPDYQKLEKVLNGELPITALGCD